MSLMMSPCHKILDEIMHRFIEFLLEVKGEGEFQGTLKKRDNNLQKGEKEECPKPKK